MGRRKILFFDIDGTLWTMDGHIPESTREAIRRVRENGHLVFINSGRTRGYIRDPKLFSLGLDGIVSGCGTMIEANALCRGMSDCRRDIPELSRMKMLSSTEECLRRNLRESSTS